MSTNRHVSNTPALDKEVQQARPIPTSAKDLTYSSNTAIITAALKEWAIVCRALEDGRQILLLRKGGIMEYRQGFEAKHNTFFLYPTFEHQSKEFIQADYTERFDLLMHEQPSRNKNTINSYARVVAVKQITDDSLIPRLQKYHIWNNSYVDVRLNYNPKRPMNVVLLRVYKIDKPIEVEVKPEWLGCKSWIPIGAPPFELQSMSNIEEQRQPDPEYRGNSVDCSNVIYYNAHPVLEDLKFEKVIAEIEEILK
ncbi:MAG TPA: DUF1802 family protein [Nitrososphaeraceae archaeon]|nr:DUF1802 family protein [Nitrososphaeraceae archaeon]